MWTLFYLRANRIFLMNRMWIWETQRFDPSNWKDGVAIDWDGEDLGWGMCLVWGMWSLRHLRHPSGNVELAVGYMSQVQEGGLGWRCTLWEWLAIGWTLKLWQRMTLTGTECSYRKDQGLSLEALTFRGWGEKKGSLRDTETHLWGGGKPGGRSVLMAQ